MNDTTTTPDTITKGLTLRWTSRKFWAMMVWEAVMVYLLREAILDKAAFVSLTYLLLGGYFVGNVAQKIWAGGEQP